MLFVIILRTLRNEFLEFFSKQYETFIYIFILPLNIFCNYFDIF